MPVAAFLRTPPVCQTNMWPLKTNPYHMTASEYAKKLLVLGLSYEYVKTLTYTHIETLSQNAGCQTKSRPSVHASPVFSDAVGLNLHAQIPDHHLILATTSKGTANGSFSLGMILHGNFLILFFSLFFLLLILHPFTGPMCSTP